MRNDPSELEAELRDLLDRGRKIEAIKRYREKTNVGLKKAKDAVEMIADSRGIEQPSRSGCLGLLFLIGTIITSFTSPLGRSGSQARVGFGGVWRLVTRSSETALPGPESPTLPQAGG